MYIPYTYKNDSIYGSVMNIFGCVSVCCVLIVAIVRGQHFHVLPCPCGTYVMYLVQWQAGSVLQQNLTDSPNKECWYRGYQHSLFGLIIEFWPNHEKKTLNYTQNWNTKNRVYKAYKGLQKEKLPQYTHYLVQKQPQTVPWRTPGQ